MDNAGVVALAKIFARHVLVRPLEEFWVGSETGLVEPPITGSILIRVGQLVDGGILEELPPKLAVSSATLHFRHVAVFHVDFDARICSGVIIGADKNAVDFNDERRIPFLLQGWIIHR